MIFRGRRRTAVLMLVLALVPGTAAACTSAQAAQSDPASSSHVSRGDLQWLNEADQANIAEIQAGEFAESKSSTAAIQAVGTTMARDHTALETRLVQVATKLHITLVSHLTEVQYETADRLSGELGYAFDHDFVASMMTAHEQMIGATETEIQHGSSPQIISLAGAALPVLQKHLKMLRAVAGSG